MVFGPKGRLVWLGGLILAPKVETDVRRTEPGSAPQPDQVSLWSKNHRAPPFGVYIHVGVVGGLLGVFWVALCVVLCALSDAISGRWRGVYALLAMPQILRDS